MKKSALVMVFAFAVIFLFFIQSAGTLVETIYILDLLNTSLDEKAAGVLFFFSPLLLLPLYRKFPRALIWFVFALAFVARGLLPNLKTAHQVLAAGLCTFAVLSLFFLLLNAKPRGEAENDLGWWGAMGLALALGLSVFLRTMGRGLDYSLTRTGAWVGWMLGLGLGAALTRLSVEPMPVGAHPKKGITTSILGVFLALTLLWFSFSAPSVMARWVEGSYPITVTMISLFTLGWLWLALARPQWLERVSQRGILLWNGALSLSLTATLLAQRITFPPTPDSPPVVVTAPHGSIQMLLYLTLVLLPVIFFDMRIFLERIRLSAPAPRDLAPGILVGGLVVILLIFAHIFTNVWGYVEPVSRPFRNQFWLPYFVLTGGMTLLIGIRTPLGSGREAKSKEANPPGAWNLLLAALFLGSVVLSFPGKRIEVAPMSRKSLVVMTFNTQQFNDESGEKAFERQLALIRRVSPDVLALQESDSARISLNNNDYVRYFSEALGCYSYYGPRPVTGTFGTAILSRYPLLNPRTVFTFSDQDEIGIAEAEIEVDGARITIYNVHPDGSDAAMLAFARTLLARAQDKPYVIALGDYNLRDDEEAYQRIEAVLVNAWTSVYPSKIGAGVDMSGRQRIDHIFVSPNLVVRNPFYILPPESATDHPVHWAEVMWK